jgi:alkanesulfonate monooxygenase SsuD/methylene tetrahydromethanopterin reductase-like flavin-dependent oxidoreductase (luciferase family)
VWPRVIQKPHPPLFYSGNSIESATFAAQNHFGLGVSYYPPHLVARLTGLYRNECAKQGWHSVPDQLIYRTFVGVAETDKEANEMKSRFFGLAAVAKSIFSGRGSAVEMKMEFSPEEMGTNADGKNSVADKGQAGFGFGGLQFCGSPDRVVKQIAEFHELTGVGVLDVSFGGQGLTPEEADRSFTLFTTEVLPRIGSIGAEASVHTEESAAAK